MLAKESAPIVLLRDLLQFRNFVAKVGSAVDQRLILLFRKMRRARHDPYMSVARAAYNNRAIGLVKVVNEIDRFKWPDKLDTPFGIGRSVIYGGD